MHDAAGSGDGTQPVARIRLRVVPGSRKAQVIGPYGDSWKVRVTAAPERGRANDDVRALLALVAGVRPSDVEIITGSASRDKLVAVHGVGFDELSRMLDAASGN
jgi:uncharacterized protein YggU (UPF0235/DUF167 family)